MYARRRDLEEAKAAIGAKKLWRIDAIEMIRSPKGQGWTMGTLDHFTVEACSEEMAVGVFKCRSGRMGWFVVRVSPETVSC